MTGPEHWREADLILTGDNSVCAHGCLVSGCPHEMAQLARAQVHATLALAAATISTGHAHLLMPDWTTWQAVVSPEEEPA